MTDFANWIENPYRAYSGSNGNKKCLIHNNKMYMVKIFNTDDKTTEFTGAISEHISCNIGRMLGLDCQKTELGVYSFNNENCWAVACEDFCNKNERLLEFSTIKNGIIDSSNEGQGKSLANVLIGIENQKLIDAEELKKCFWDMFIFDALIGNFDRHPGNFGIIVNEEEQKARIAPIYDCGSTLFPGAMKDEKIMRDYLSNEKEQESRVYEYPRSALRDDNGKKINYFDYIFNGINADCTKALLRITPRIDIEKIRNFINNTNEITGLQKEFCCKVLESRKEKILDYCFSKFETKDLNFELNKKGDNTFNLMMEKEKILIENLDDLHGANKRYGELYIEEKNKSKEKFQFMLNSNTDVKIAIMMLKERYTKKRNS